MLDTTLMRIEMHMKCSGSLYSEERVALLPNFVYMSYNGYFRHVDSAFTRTTTPNRLRISEMLDMTLMMVKTYMKRSGSLY